MESGMKLGGGWGEGLKGDEAVGKSVCRREGG